ncbi:MAG: uroporphyrinogen-III C-methyltransferase [Synergistaceae bacterium]|nr:uroporphyrinogen-III C-methyltransferase [Synergistaceae bacterium]
MIFLLGAGPGDAGLLTLRGCEILSRADVVIYDRLVGDGILAMIPETAEKIDAGKIAGSHKISQREIENLIITKAMSDKNKNIVRLKGGDSFLFGRGGEEAQAIINAGLNFEVVPGVSSALAVPAWAGVPPTHRNFSSGVNIFTAHDKNNLIPDFNDATAIFLMGVGNSKELQTKLLEKFSPDMPCAIISNGTTARQKIIKTPLKNLSQSCKKINPPAVILVGKVAELNLDWRKNLPLRDKKILITRPAGRSEKLAAMLRDAGAEVIIMPTIKTSVIKNSLDNKNISGYSWAAFTSVTGVEAFFELLRDSGRDVRELGNAKITAIGQATAEALKLHGLRVDFVPEIFDGENLAEGLVKLLTPNSSLLTFRALDGTPEIAKIFQKNKISYDEICIYKTDFVKLNHVPKFIDIIIFTSASTVKGFCASADPSRVQKAVCIGRQTAEEAGHCGFADVITAKKASVEEIFNACVNS